MKVNTDGVLLAAWSSVPVNGGKVLDIGAGTGVISLIVAQRTENHTVQTDIHAIEIDSVSADECRENFISSPWSGRLSVTNISLKSFLTNYFPPRDGEYSNILTNPPYFTQSLKADSQRKSIARHNDSMPFEQIALSSSVMLKENGTLSIILPIAEFARFKGCANEMGLYLNRECIVKTVENKPPKRVMAEFTKGLCPLKVNDAQVLVMQEIGGEYYTEQYCSLVEDYYQKSLKKMRSSI